MATAIEETEKDLEINRDSDGGLTRQGLNELKVIIRLLDKTDPVWEVRAEDLELELIDPQSDKGGEKLLMSKGEFFQTLYCLQQNGVINIRVTQEGTAGPYTIRVRLENPKINIRVFQE